MTGSILGQCKLKKKQQKKTAEERTWLKKKNHNKSTMGQVIHVICIFKKGISLNW